MIGNDIVDLQVAKKHHSRWLEVRLLDKVFTRSEQQMILGSENQFRTVWQLWSMKESAYKVFVQQHKLTFLNPLKIQCSFNSATLGSVFIDKQEYSTSSVLEKEFIYTTAFSNKPDHEKSRYFRSNHEEYSALRRKCYSHFMASYSKETEINRLSMKIKKSEVGIPELLVNGIKANISLSITHHGAFYGFAYCHVDGE